jgi:hypothetical protein
MPRASTSERSGRPAEGIADSAYHSDQTTVLDTMAGGVFVGRQRELGRLKVALEDALLGRGRLVMVVGEPSIGKNCPKTPPLSHYQGKMPS